MAVSSAVDPDQFLDLSRETPFSREEGLAAWDHAYSQWRQQGFDEVEVTDIAR